ncbi:hypothetical protein WH47_12135 [Habropoda laboriosa]|uniref:Uncharacterized protein n=1 Tax=Habropoda laboriosa TaxID=597456 RepID=A0A0L7RAC0_9HYME|nr:PREDICTED: uncharacterized protein LOC108580220 [Habropoda laboriosa]KOC67805.1 hypothetical protein WH47_12135 [Habropoda laboriosa]
MRTLWPLLLILAEILQLILGEHACHSNDTELTAFSGQRSTKILSRRRRLTFPKGSTFVLTTSILQPVQLKLPSNWNMDFEFDMIWPILPPENFRKKFYVKRPWLVKRRHRRDLYATFESALNSRNLPGRLCILRTICEAKTLLSPPGVSFIEDAIRLILSNVENVKKEEEDSYDVAYRNNAPCEDAYPCPVSFLRLLLYNVYPDGLS